MAKKTGKPKTKPVEPSRESPEYLRASAERRERQRDFLEIPFNNKKLIESMRASGFIGSFGTQGDDEPMFGNPKKSKKIKSK